MQQGRLSRFDTSWGVLKESRAETLNLQGASGRGTEGEAGHIRK